MILVGQDGRIAYNLSMFQSIRVNNCSVVLYPSVVLGRYESEERAQDIFENMLMDFEKATLPFTDTKGVYYMPEE